MPFKKLISIDDEDLEFIHQNENRVGVNATSFINSAIKYYISHLKEVRLLVEERQQKQKQMLLEHELQQELNNKK